MTEKTVRELEDQWHLLMAAVDPKSGVRMCERDAKYAREVFQLGVHISDRKKAEAPGAQIATHQLAQFAWLDRAHAARGKDGKLLTEQDVHGTPHATDFARNLQAARAIVAEGKALPSEYIANTERWLTDQGASMSAAPAAARVVDTTPVAPLAQATNSFIKGSK